MAVFPTAVSTGWIFPRYDYLTIDNSSCKVGIDWATAVLTNIKQSENQIDSLINAPADTTAKYIESLVPSNWTHPHTRIDLMAWYFEVLTNATLADDFPEVEATNQMMLYYPFTKCGTDICPKLGWKGDPDVSGIGMMVSYGLAAALSTIYFIVIASTSLGLFRPTPSRASNFKFVRAFRESVNIFLDCALIFAVSMLGAAVVRYARVMMHPEEDYSYYSLLGSVFMAAFSVLPALLLQTVADGLHGKILRQALWFMLIVTAVAVEVLYQLVYKKGYLLERDQDVRDRAQIGQYAWIAFCEKEDQQDELSNLLTGAHVLLAINVIWWIYYFVSSAFPADSRMRMKIHDTAFWRLWKMARPYMRAINGVVCLVFMWLLFGKFTRYRATVSDLAGNADQDSIWTFGQVLALATWAPVLVDLVAIFFFGPENGLRERLSDRYKVVSASSDEEAGASSKELLNGSTRYTSVRGSVSTQPSPHREFDTR